MSTLGPEVGRPQTHSDGPEVLHDTEKHVQEYQNALDAPRIQPEKEASPGQYENAHLARICGLPKTIFWLTTMLIAAIVVAAALGGGLGGALAHRNASAATTITTTQLSPSHATSSSVPHSSASTLTTSSSTISSSTPGPSPLVSTVTTDCPGSNDTIYNSTMPAEGPILAGAVNGLTFIKYCNLGIVQKYLSGVFVYTYDDCVEACAGYNFFGNTTVCNTAAFLLGGSRPVNCWIGTRDTSAALAQNGTKAWDCAVLLI